MTASWRAAVREDPDDAFSERSRVPLPIASPRQRSFQQHHWLFRAKSLTTTSTTARRRGRRPESHPAGTPMSEYQRIAFRAIDGPVSAKDLAFMRKQSNVAEITPWAFDNEYHYGDFHGDAAEMLRRGYDLYLHYATFGVRTLQMRLPYGLPDPAAAAPYLGEEFVQFLPDKCGPGGILVIEPYFEAGELDDSGPGRGPRPAAPAAGRDPRRRPAPALPGPPGDRVRRQPRPGGDDGGAGPGRVKEAVGRPAGAYAIPRPERVPGRGRGPGGSRRWPRATPESSSRSGSPASRLRPRTSGSPSGWPTRTRRKEMLAEFQQAQDTPLWPTVTPARTIAELMADASKVQEESDRKAKEKAAQKRAKRLAGMLADPERTLRKTEELVAGAAGRLITRSRPSWPSCGRSWPARSRRDWPNGSGES